MDLGEISQLIGYAARGAGAFRRAFQRRSGTTPANWRAARSRGSLSVRDSTCPCRHRIGCLIGHFIAVCVKAQRRTERVSIVATA